MKKTKRLLALLLALVMGISALTGCGKKDAKSKKTGANGEITLTIGLPINVKVEDYETNAFTKWLEETTGYNLDFVTFSSQIADYKSQVATRLDDLPDILWGMDLGAEAARSYGKDEYILDLTSYFEDKEKSKVFWDRFAELPEDFQEYIKLNMPDKETGAIYAFPSIETAMADTIDYQAYINQTWLDNLGLAMPNSPESLYEVLMAFKNKDANGNGDPSDELPLMGYEKGYCGDVVNWLVNMFVYADDNKWWNVDKDGQLYLPYTTDEYREALKYINKLVKAGVLLDTAWAGSHKDIASVINVDRAKQKVGIWLGHPTAILESNAEAVYDYVAMPYWGYAVYKDNVFEKQTFITADCEYPDAAWEVLMAMCSEEGATRMRYGEYGVDWVEADEGSTSYVGLDAKIKVLNEGAFNAQGNQTWGINKSSIIIWSENEAVELSDKTDDCTKYRLNMVSDCIDNYAKAAEKNPDPLVPALSYTTEQSKATENERENSRSYIRESRSQFCIGTKDVSNDKVWKEYLDGLNANGFEVWRKQAQEIYNAQIKK